VNLESAINVPINSDWAARVSAQAQSRNDRVNNPQATGTRSQKATTTMRHAFNCNTKIRISQHY
jgi:hypothetical protein